MLFDISFEHINCSFKAINTGIFVSDVSKKDLTASCSSSSIESFTTDATN